MIHPEKNERKIEMKMRAKERSDTTDDRSGQMNSNKRLQVNSTRFTWRVKISVAQVKENLIVSFV